MARKKKKQKQEKLTKRQLQSRQIMRDKQAKKTRKTILRRAQIAAAVILSVGTVGGGVWLWHSGTAVRAWETTVDGGYRLTADAGFAVKSLYLDGRNRTPMKVVEEALGVEKGDPILRLSLSELRERLEKVESIRFAAVERELPGTLYIHIVEREPVAMWQKDGKIALVDDNGVVMHGLDMAAYTKLPLIVGEDAPRHVGEILRILASEPSLIPRFTAAVRVGGRRWNVMLGKGIEVKLPEDDPLAAWKSLAELQSDQQLLDRDVKVIDLRLPDRLFIKLTPDEKPNKAASAKET